MKRLLFAAVALLIAGNTFAIKNEPESGFTHKAMFGMSTSNILKWEVNDKDYKAKVGATLGYQCDFMLPKAHGAYVSAGLNWTMKGAQVEWSDFSFKEGPVKYSHKVPVHYLEIPIRGGFRYNINEDFGVFGEVGPYFAIGVGGHCSDSYTDYEGKTTNHYAIFDKDGENFRRFDAGLSFVIGAEYKNHFNVNLGFNYGAVDLQKDNEYWVNDEDREWYEDIEIYAKKKPIHNFNMTLTVGYRF